MRTEALNAPTPRPAAASRERAAPVPPREPREERQAFESALQRAGRRGPGLGDEEPPPQAVPVEPLPPLPQSVSVAVAARAEAPTSTWSPQALPPPCAVTRHLQALAPLSHEVQPGHWQLQVSAAGLPVQRVDIERTAAGALAVVVTAVPAAQQALHTARLRQRLAARTDGSAALAFRSPQQDAEA